MWGSRFRYSPVRPLWRLAAAIIVFYVAIGFAMLVASHPW